MPTLAPPAAVEIVPLTPDLIRAAAAVDVAVHGTGEAADVAEATCDAADVIRAWLRDRRVGGAVARLDGRAVGYALYRVHSGRAVYVLELSVRPECQRRGVGQRMVAALLANMAVGGPGWELRAVVAEDNLDGQLFARRCGFWGRLTADGIEFTRTV